SVPEGFDKPISSEPTPSHQPWASARARPLADSRERNPLRARAVVAVDGDNRALLAGLGNGQLRGAFGTLRECHDVLAQLVVTRFAAEVCQSLGDFGSFHFAPRGSSCRRLASRSEPQRIGIEIEQAWRLRSSVTELEAQFDSVELRRGSGR